MHNDIRTRGREIKKVLILILVLNWLVAFAKILLGVLSRCSSITADGFHSLSDGASNIIGLVGISVASQPTDKEHPYGHKKYETFFSLAIAALLFLVAYELLETALKRLRTPVTPEVDLKSFLVMAGTLVANIFIMRYERAKGRKLQSDILVSDALHTRSDIAISISVIVTLFAIRMGIPLADPVITIVIAFFIAYSGYKVAVQGSNILCDKAAITEEEKIAQIVLSVAGVKTCHKIRTRGREDDIHVDLHVQVHPGMAVKTAHQISYQIEEKIKHGIAGVTDVVVHIEPQEH